MRLVQVTALRSEKIAFFKNSLPMTLSPLSTHHPTTWDEPFKKKLRIGKTCLILIVILETEFLAITVILQGKYHDFDWAYSGFNSQISSYKLVLYIQIVINVGCRIHTYFHLYNNLQTAEIRGRFSNLETQLKNYLDGCDEGSIFHIETKLKKNYLHGRDEGSIFLS